MKTEKKRIIIIIILVILSLYVLLFTPKSFNRIYSFQPSKITSIEIRSGNTGNTIRIEDKKQIEELAKSFSQITVKRDFSKEENDGWLYSYIFYEKSAFSDEENEVFEVTTQGNYIINDKNYTVTKMNGSNPDDIAKKLLK